MPNSPIYLNTNQHTLNILQLTDLHLTADSSMYSCRQRFEALLNQALEQSIAEGMKCDLILVTGDLVSQVDPAIYDYIFALLTATNIAFACIAGNHDVTDEVGSNLPFEQRQLIAREADSRLLSRHVIESKHWQILLLNSAIAGQVAGRIKNEDIAWLCAQLEYCDKPALLAVHHHLIPMQSEWIDAYKMQNAEQFWQRTKDYDNLRVIINGHTHQEQVQHRNGVIVYTTPSTCYQYQPLNDDFAYDKTARPGYRWLQLANNGQVASWVKRLDT